MFIRPGIELANLTDTGTHRSENQDYYCYVEPESDADFLLKGRLAVIADGMGGHQGGQIASRIAAERVRDTYLAHPGGDPRDSLIAAFRDAHAAIQDYGRKNPEFAGLGTTCTSVVLKDDRLYYGHVGDSRLYLIRDGAISLLTEDHSYVQKLVRQGMLTSEEAAVHPDRNILTAALGMPAAVPADFSSDPIPLYARDLLMLCTDGLHGLVSDQELLALASLESPQAVCRGLIDAAIAGGGFDNITVQILRVV